MDDRYQSEYRHSDRRPRDDYYDRDYYRDRDHYHDYDHYDRQDRDRDSYRQPPYQDERPRGGEYAFRGAANHEFSFRAPVSSAPRFPPAEQYAPSQPQQSRARRQDQNRRAERPPPGARYGGASRGRGRGGFRPRPAHNRDILNKTGRETTPELLDGMYIDGEARFREVASSDDDGSDNEVIDLTRDSGEDTAKPRKRTKVEAQPETAAPKWSNPDPYDALPPPATLGAPKKDIVKVIRKAKVDAAPKPDEQNAVKDNADFISLNFDDDVEDGQMSDEGESVAEVQAPPNASKAPPNFSHRDEFHAKLPSTRPAPQAQPAALYLNEQHSLPPVVKFDGPPSSPPGLVMPTDEELMAQYATGGLNKKRKHDDITSSTEYDIIQEWEANHTNSTPWCTIDHSRTASSGLRLHKEICDFFEFVRPYEYEEAVRQDLITRIEKATRQAYIPGANNVEIKCFGSFAAGLYLPTADMDLVAVSPAYLRTGRKSFCQSRKPMFNLSDYLQNAGIAARGGVTVLHKTRVPIIKFSDKNSGIKVDISFENDSGLHANQTFQEWKAQYPDMPVIVVLIKQMLAMRGLNEVFSGGIGGFTIICLVVSMMQLMPELQSGSMEPNMHYGDLLLNFLDLYGNKFDIRATGITMNPPGYFDKKNEPRRSQHPQRLTIIDPNKPDNDISGGSSRIDAVLDCFRHAHSQLQRRLAEIHQGRNVEGSILGCVWGGNYTSFIRQREKLSLLHRGYAVSPPPPEPAPKANTRAARAIGRAQKHAEKKAAKQMSKQSQIFVAAQQNSLPQRPVALTRQPQGAAQGSAPAWQPIHGRPQTHPLPPRPGVLPQLPAQNGAGSSPSAPKSKGRKPKRAATRAKRFKAQFPHVPDVPAKLKPSQLEAICKQHGIDVTTFDRTYELGPDDG